MKIFKTLISTLLIAALVFSFSAGAFAEEYNLENGAITIRGDDAAGQTVSQNGGAAVVDLDPVITGTFTGQGVSSIPQPTDAAVLIYASNGDVNVTFSNATVDNSFVHASGANHDVTMSFEGDNSFSFNDKFSAVSLSQAETVTIKGVDDSSTLNINDSKGGIQTLDIGTLNIEDINLNMDNVETGAFLQKTDIVNINHSNLDINATAYATTFSTDYETSFNSTNCTEVSPKIESVVSIGGGFSTIADENGNPIANLKIEKLETPASSGASGQSALFFDAMGIHEGKIFYFTCDENAVLSISCNGKELVKGTDYTLAKDGDLLSITFTDAFFAANGNGPVDVYVKFATATYTLSVVNK